MPCHVLHCDILLLVLRWKEKKSFSCSQTWGIDIRRCIPREAAIYCLTLEDGGWMICLPRDMPQQTRTVREFSQLCFCRRSYKQVHAKSSFNHYDDDDDDLTAESENIRKIRNIPLKQRDLLPTCFCVALEAHTHKTTTMLLYFLFLPRIFRRSRLSRVSSPNLFAYETHFARTRVSFA